MRFRRTEDSLEVDLGDHAAEDLRYIDVEWPSERLRDIVLIDTPGLASISEDVSRRTERFLASDEEGPGDADAVIYLMRHLHPMDLSFLEAFRETVATQGAAVNSIAVLSRADEIGAARTNALQAAERVAARYRQDRRIDSLCQVVIPVAGLIAQAAASLREGETNALRTLAALPREQVDRAAALGRALHRARLAGKPRSGDAELACSIGSGCSACGWRWSCSSPNASDSAGEVARELERRSGILELRQVLTGQFASRAAVLKARSTLATVVGAGRPSTAAPRGACFGT